MLVSLKEIFNKYKKSGAIPAFNVANVDMIIAVIDAAKIENKPVVIQVFRRLIEDETCRYLAEIIKSEAGKTDIPIVLHLDHGLDICTAKKAIEFGFSSIMIDGSCLSYDENVSLVWEVKRLVESFKMERCISIEAELGGIPKADIKMDEQHFFYTDPEEASRFVKDTGIDALAISIGTAHGLYLERPEIKFDLLKSISKKVPVPLVLHGGTGLTDEDIKKSINCGIRKVNIATELQKYYITAIKESEISNNGKFIPWDILIKPIRGKLTDIIREKIKLIS